MRRLIFFSFIIVISSFLTCTNHYETKQQIDKLYNSRKQFIEQFKFKSILTGGSNIFFTIYSEKGENVFSFERDKQTNKFNLIYSSIKDTTGLKQLLILSSDVFSEQSSITREITSILAKDLRILKDYSIRGVTSEFQKNGINLKFYLNSSAVVLYVDAPSSLAGDWQKYILEAKRLDSNWYYYESEFSKSN